MSQLFHIKIASLNVNIVQCKSKIPFPSSVSSVWPIVTHTFFSYSVFTYCHLRTCKCWTNNANVLNVIYLYTRVGHNHIGSFWTGFGSKKIQHIYKFQLQIKCTSNYSLWQRNDNNDEQTIHLDLLVFVLLANCPHTLPRKCIQFTNWPINKLIFLYRVK